jgi:nitroimidazol reductase NimA-like FMN-containing flavoprotein (pyridoxamine 5'-phosphate oxidase superfamily)
MPDKRVENLTTAECRELLDRHHFGRLAFVDSVGVLPSIIPINYLLTDDKVVFRTDAGSKLAAAVRRAPVAFEVDGVDERRRVGWSVLVRGRAEEITDEARLAQLRQTPLLAWAPGAKEHYVRINASKLSGRRISIAELPSNWWG